MRLPPFLFPGLLLVFAAAGVDARELLPGRDDLLRQPEPAGPEALSDQPLSPFSIPEQKIAAPRFGDVSVHDPAVIRVDGETWVFGSHLAAAWSRDLVEWTLFADGVNEDNPLFDNVVTELEETFTWSGEVGLWANEVFRLPDGRFAMYYNLSRIDQPRASLGLAFADQVDGPYEDDGILLQSGMPGASEDGTQYDPRVHPNAVDPDLFTDTSGTLWMVYGSYSGGIFLLEMDPVTGRPLPGQGYGQRLMGGNHSRIEGAHILYSPESRWYYLFISFGGLAADGGYNVRVARSRDPRGPYLDAQGNDMTDVMADPSLPLFDDASIEPFAVKLVGGHRFERRVGESGTGTGHGYVSPGHSTAFYDKALGRHFLIFHTRFPGRGEAHQVRVHELLINSEGWPVVAPHRYAPLAAMQTAPPSSPQPKPGADCGPCSGPRLGSPAGDWRLVNHGKDISGEVKASSHLELHGDGSVGGAVSGSWHQWRDGHLTLELNGLGLFQGVLSRGWDEAGQRWTLFFSALSQDGVALWGARLAQRSRAQVLDDIAADLVTTLPGSVTANLDLPGEATRDATITWQSSAPAVIGTDGTVNRPQSGQPDRAVTLTATIRHDGAQRQQQIDVTVPARSGDGLLAHYAFDSNLSETAGRVADGVVSGAFIDTGGGQVNFGAGVSGQAAMFDGSSGIRLPDGLVPDDSYTVSVWLRPAALTPFTTAFFGARDNANWLSLVPMGGDFVSGQTMVWSGENWFDAPVGSTIPANAWTHLAFTVENRTIRVYVDGVTAFTGGNFPVLFANTQGIFSLGVNWWDTPFQGMMDELRVYETALDANAIGELAAEGD